MVSFGRWWGIDEGLAAAPEGAGLLQVRGEAVRDYPRGRSAMVLYARTLPDETLRGFLAGRGAGRVARAVAAGGSWIRFAATAAPEVEHRRLMGRFEERFGAVPAANEQGD